MKHLAPVTKSPAAASSTIETITETKIETKESFINAKVG